MPPEGHAKAVCLHASHGKPCIPPDAEHSGMDTAEPSLITHTPCDDPEQDEKDEGCCSVEQLRLLRAYTQRRGGHLSRLVRRKQAAVIPGSSAQSIVWDILSSRKPLSTSLSICHVQALLLTAGLLLTALNCARVVLQAGATCLGKACMRSCGGRAR